MFSSGQAHAELPDEERVGEPLGFQRSDWLCHTGAPSGAGGTQGGPGRWGRKHLPPGKRRPRRCKGTDGALGPARTAPLRMDTRVIPKHRLEERAVPSFAPGLWPRWPHLCGVSVHSVSCSSEPPCCFLNTQVAGSGLRAPLSRIPRGRAQVCV